MNTRPQRETFVLLAICIAIVANAIAYGAILPLLPIIGEQVDAGPFELALLYAMYPLSLLVSVIPLGIWSDRYGRRPVIIAGTALLFITTAGFALSNQYWEFAVFRLVQGISDGAVWVSALPLVAEIGDRAKLGRRSGLIMMSFGLGMIVGPALGATGSIMVTYGALAVFSLFVLLFISRALHGLPQPAMPTGRILHRFRGLLSNPAVAIACMAIMVYGFVFGALEPILPPFFYGTLTVAVIGFYLMVFNGVFTFTQPLFGRLSDRYGEMPFIYIGITAIIIILPLFAMTMEPLVWLVLLFVLGICDAAAATPSLSLLNRGIGDDERGLASSLYNILFSVGALTGPIVIGAVVAGAGYLSGMLTMSAVCVFVMLAMMSRSRSIKNNV